MNIVWFRDLTIIIFNLVAVFVLIFTAIILYLTWKRMAVILENVRTTTQIMEEISTGIKPLLQIISVFNILKGFIKKQGGAHGD